MKEASMRRRFTFPLAAGLAALLLGGVVASAAYASDEHHTALPAGEVQWMDGPPHLPGSELAVLHGSQSEEGAFVIRLKFPGDYEIPPHWHSKEEHLTIISGRFGVGTGEALDRDRASLLEPGSFARIPAEMPHFVWTEEETVVQINGMGPFDLYYVNPDDDPRS
jgi:mannose-6-phosphate isomerase-like protein (cupin superfamily)